MKEYHVSHNKMTGEVFYDRFNIDFLRYFGVSSAIRALAGSLVGTIVYIKYFAGFFYSLDMSTLYLLFLGGGFFWFILTAAIAYVAVGSFEKGSRIAGRRGLFTFSMMLIGGITLLFISGIITMDVPVYYFVKTIMGAVIVMSFLTVPLDYGYDYFKGR
jgi:hypothetical protein